MAQSAENYPPPTHTHTLTSEPVNWLHSGWRWKRGNVQMCINTLGAMDHLNGSQKLPLPYTVFIHLHVLKPASLLTCHYSKYHPPKVIGFECKHSLQASGHCRLTRKEWERKVRNLGKNLRFHFHRKLFYFCFLIKVYLTLEFPRVYF